MSDTQGGAYGPRRLSWDQPAPADLHDHLHPPQEPTMTTTAPEDQAAQALAASSTDALLRAAYTITHHIHAAQQVAYVPDVREEARLREADLRAQRDLITAEVLRRTGGQ